MLCLVSIIKRLVVVWSWLYVVTVNATEKLYTYPAGVKLHDGQIFDYIVVGAGAAGCAVAARLALARYDVLLIEAGGDPNLFSKIPGAAMALTGSDIDWHYNTISNNKSCLSSIDRACRFARGKCLGGSTSINYMLYTRGNRKKDFEEIPHPGWNFEDLMPYYLRYEGLRDLDKLPSSSKPYHNTSGNMRIGFFDDPQNPWHSRLKSAIKCLKFPENKDVNAQSQIGYSQVIGYVDRGERMSTARGYLTLESVKKTLKIAKQTMCTRVIIDEDKVAKGVIVYQALQNLRLFAQKEIILSAGTIGTPQILMLSGVGPADHLNSMGIPIKMDLPVGDGMTDHIFPLLFVQVDKGFNILDTVKTLASTATHLAELVIARRGALTSNGLTDITLFANTNCYDFKLRQLVNESSSGSDCEVPNLQMINAYIDKYIITAAKPLVQNAIGLNDNIMNQLSDANAKSAFVVMAPILLEPHSKGTVRLASTDPLVPPAILPNYLDDKRDVENMVRFINIVEHIVDTATFRKQAASLLHFKLPECPSYEDDKLEYMKCYVRHLINPAYHSAGTVPLGAVLDQRLRVLGVKRLRVADLSVLPLPPRSNTAAVTIAIGERAADFVLQDNKC